MFRRRPIGFSGSSGSQPRTEILEQRCGCTPYMVNGVFKGDDLEASTGIVHDIATKARRIDHVCQRNREHALHLVMVGPKVDAGIQACHHRRHAVAGDGVVPPQVSQRARPALGYSGLFPRFSQRGFDSRFTRCIATASRKRNLSGVMLQLAGTKCQDNAGVIVGSHADEYRGSTRPPFRIRTITANGKLGKRSPERKELSRKSGFQRFSGSLCHAGRNRSVSAENGY